MEHLHTHHRLLNAREREAESERHIQHLLGERERHTVLDGFTPHLAGGSAGLPPRRDPVPARVLQGSPGVESSGGVALVPLLKCAMPLIFPRVPVHAVLKGCGAGRCVPSGAIRVWQTTRRLRA